ncbi:hypothetical protein MST27_16280 [Pseudomonas sp. PS1]|uniref:Uncharacterized protein n=1 Tax=Stutzerimonas marianensis TaxID=2929513 RepID=A0A9X2AVR8_9GAMM|nr:hypothetical protein [Pseudomonas marianensis]MCJ0974932.1 hypothetical protein [Pseudomonas marianensis]
MNIRMMLVAVGLGLATQASADSRGGVWVYQPDGGSYRVESGPRVYDPRSPYSNFPQYRQNLPPRMQGQLPPRYYDRHRGHDGRGWNRDRRSDWKSHDRHGRLDRPQRWHRDDGRRHDRPPVRDYRAFQQRSYGGGYRR